MNTRYKRNVLLTIAEVANLLHVSRMHITNLIDSGQLKALNLATHGSKYRTLRIPITEVNRFLLSLANIEEKE